MWQLQRAHCAMSLCLLSLLTVTIAMAFQSPILPSTRTVTTSTLLFYKNKTEAFYDPPPPIADEDNVISTSWGSYRDTGESVAVLEKPVLELDELLEYDDFDRSNDDEAQAEEDWTTELYGDEADFQLTVPTLELLQSWTQEYVDTVDLAGGMTRVSVGVQNMLSSEFVFTSPTLGPLNNEDYVKLMDYYRHCGLDLASAIPDLKVTYDGWHVDPHEPWRLWAVARYSGTHLGTANVPGTDLKLTPPNKGDHSVKFMSGPEMHSFLWTTDKKLLWHSMGYVGDEYTGSNQGYGGLDGLLVSMGLPHLYLDALSPMRKAKSWFSQFQSDQGESMGRAKTRYGRLPQWWNERKSYDLNIYK